LQFLVTSPNEVLKASAPFAADFAASWAALAITAPLASKSFVSSQIFGAAVVSPPVLAFSGKSLTNWG
jgi:hypothetical protein